jgi:class 3 adenylate cyclase/tetratricopeptide (TPR) repeat protein
LARTNETELRRGTILFADITGFTSLNESLDPEDAYRIVSDCLLMLDGICRRHGANIDKYLGDAVMATFGIPNAIEDAPRAAINAAIEMHNSMDRFNRERHLESPLDIHSGITTGLVISGDVSGPITREFSVMGDPVNIAARLKDLAPTGTIWVGDETHAATRDDFEFRPLEPLRLKGKEKVVAAYEVVSRVQRLHRRLETGKGRITSRLVGRDAEMERLSGIAEQVAASGGAIVSLFGEAGTGKSRIVSELEQSEEGRALGWMTGRCVPSGSKLSFHPFASLLRSWVGVGEEGDDLSALEGLESATSRLFQDEASEVVPFLANVMGIALPPHYAEHLAGIEGEAMENLVVKAMTQVLRRLADAFPIALVFEDVHWSDGSSLSLIESLARLARDHRILFLLTGRPGHPDTSDGLRRTIENGFSEIHTRIDLDRLDPAASHQLIESLFAKGGLPYAIQMRIEERAGGNPFFIEEVVRSLLGEGVIEWREDGLWSTEGIDDVQIPGSVHEVVMARIDRLELRVKHVLQVVSVIGRRADSQLLSAVAGDDGLDECLERLTGAQLLTIREGMGRMELVFHHPLIQEVTYSMILKAKRRKLHQAVAEAMEELLPRNAPGRAAMLAYHLSLGPDPEIAEESLFQAGDEAARIAAPSEALYFFREASKLYFASHGEGGDPGKKAMLEKKIALAHYNRGESIEANRHFDRALEFLGEPPPQGTFAVATRLVRTIPAVLAHLYSPFGSRRRPPSERERELIELMLDRARMQLTADAARFLTDTMDGVRMLAKLDAASFKRSGTIAAGAVGLFSIGGFSFGIAERFLSITRDLVREDDAQDLLLYSLVRFAHKFLLGDWDDAYEIDPMLISKALRMGELHDVTACLGFLAEKKLYQGRFRESAEHLEQIAKIEDLYGYDVAQENRECVTALLALQQRRLDAALAAVNEYLKQEEAAVNLLGLGIKAEIQTLQGDRDSAREVLEQAERIVNQQGFLFPYHLSGYWRARLRFDVAELEATLASGDRAGGRRTRRRSARSAKKSIKLARKVARERPQAHRNAGTRSWLIGNRRAALRYWVRSLEHAEKLGMKPELARTYHEAGKRLSPTNRNLAGLSGAACLERAEELFRELGLELECPAQESSPPDTTP